MKEHTITNCPGCKKKYPKSMILREKGCNWSAAAYCDNCRPDYLTYIGVSDDELETWKPIQEDMMQGWTNGNHPNSVSLHVATKPRALIRSGV